MRRLRRLLVLLAAAVIGALVTLIGVGASIGGANSAANASTVPDGSTTTVSVPETTIPPETTSTTVAETTTTTVPETTTTLDTTTTTEATTSTTVEQTTSTTEGSGVVPLPRPPVSEVDDDPVPMPRPEAETVPTVEPDRTYQPVGSDANPRRELPRTGASANYTAAVGIVLVVVGIGALVIKRFQEDMA